MSTLDYTDTESEVCFIDQNLILENPKAYLKSNKGHQATAGKTWTDDDCRLFAQSLRLYGKNYHKISEQFPERTFASVSNHIYKFKKKYKSDPDQCKLDGYDDILAILEGPNYQSSI